MSKIRIVLSPALRKKFAKFLKQVNKLQQPICGISRDKLALVSPKRITKS